MVFIYKTHSRAPLSSQYFACHCLRPQRHKLHHHMAEEEEAGEEEEGVAAMKRGTGERRVPVDKGCEEAELKRRRTLVLGCEATGVVGGGGGVEEDMVESWLMDGDAVLDVMQLLDEGGGGPAEVPVQWSTIADTTSGGGYASRVRFIADPYASPLVFQSSCSYITINGNEESCGSSFSDWESSVMASVDTGGRMMLNVRGLGGGGGSNVEDQGYYKTDCSGARGAKKVEASAITAAEGEKASGAVGGGIWGMGLADCCRDGLGWEWDDLARFLDDDVLDY